MKCEHDVKRYEWQRCSRCGKIVRRKEKRETIRKVLIGIGTFQTAPFNDGLIKYA